MNLKLTLEQRWIFWINLPFCGLTFVMIPWCLKLQYKSDSFLAKLKQIDWIGSAAFVGSITSFLIPITWGGVMYSWTDWRTLVPLLLGTAGLVGFLVYSKYVPAQPLIKGSIFSTRTAIVSYLGTLLHGAIASPLSSISPFRSEMPYLTLVSSSGLSCTISHSTTKPPSPCPQ